MVMRGAWRVPGWRGAWNVEHWSPPLKCIFGHIMDESWHIAYPVFDEAVDTGYGVSGEI